MNREDIVELINCIFHDYEVSHLIWNGMSWYSHTVFTWREKRWVPCGEVGENDPDCPCYGYWGHVWNKDTEDKDANSDDEEELPYTLHEVKKLDDVTHVFVKSYSTENPKFNLEDKITLELPLYIANGMGLNPDHRGSNHMGIEIDALFEGDIKIPAGDYTFKELANLVWRCKANKFDNQYEMVFHLEKENVDLEEDGWYIDLIVDHGS